MTQYTDSEEDTRAELKASYHCTTLLRKHWEQLKGVSLGTKKDAEADKMDKFLCGFEMNQKAIFGHVTYKINHNKLVNL